MGTATLGYAGGPTVAFRIDRNIMLVMTDECSFPGCHREIKAKSARLCGTHYERKRKYGDPSVVLKVGAKPGKKRELSSQWKGDEAGLDAQHKRIRAVRGAPRQCDHCGTTDPDKYYHWAFNNTGNRLNVWDYLRLCASCHRIYDDGFTPRGSKHGNAKLTEANIPEIFRMRAEGVLLREIAGHFGVSIGTLSAILDGSTWKHVPRG